MPMPLLYQTYDSEWNMSCDFPSHTCNRSLGTQLTLPIFSTAAKVRVTITFILCAVSGICNFAVICSAYGGRRKSHVRLLMLNLSVADLLVTFIVMPLDAAWNLTVQWLAGDFACRLLMFLKLMAMYSCAFVTVVISLDRQSAILNPLAINKARRRNTIQLTVAWTLSAVLSLPQAFLFHQVTITSPAHFTQCMTHGSFQQQWQETLYNMFTFCFLFLLPLLIMVSCYTRILLEISRGMLGDSSSANEIRLRRSNNNIIPKARMRTLKMSIVIVSSFIVCWTPYYLLGLWYWFSPEGLVEAVSDSLTHLLFLFGLLNACLDPLIYGLFSLPLRRSRPAVTVEMESTTHVTTLSCRQLTDRDASRTQEQRKEGERGEQSLLCNSDELL
ncbi:putative gonadotropin-releasing hormone II receptor isoform X1 [Alosa sapidissima]|uniref:putative gonadotropin-releasing hormone II receptor isoform X1 n=2 Tax=Alosa sapidissima TaxID=34773 RepID=UPI001C0A30ED|nr:putative gonadotropin-releasing hormone II receptor isoform X1 [Alosa sapidissima]XP_041918394.1 putative gonadotropin-releasing hormone II receptor isoform X1 [Alosa sapidissima]